MKPIKPTAIQDNLTPRKTRIDREHQIRRDTDTLKNPAVTLYDIDYAILYYIENVIKPLIISNDVQVAVPVQFVSGEKWASIRLNGFMRDGNNKMLTPIIAIRRNGITERTDVTRNSVVSDEENTYIYEKKYSSANRYDPFSILNSKQKVKEYYSIPVPKYVDIEYELIVWADHTEQLNALVEQLIAHDGKAFGETYKFTTMIEQPSFDSSNEAGEDRVVKATFNMRTKGFLLPERRGSEVTTKKMFGPNKIIVTSEVVGSIEELNEAVIKLNNTKDF